MSEVASSENEPVAEDRQPPSLVDAVESHWKQTMRRWRRIARIHVGRLLLNCRLTLRRTGGGESTITPGRLRRIIVGFRKRPVTAATALVIVLAGGYAFYSQRQDAEAPRVEDNRMALDDVKVFPAGSPDVKSSQSVPKKLPVQVEPKAAVADSNPHPPVHTTGKGPRLLGPQFPTNAREVSQTDPPDYRPVSPAARPPRVVWFTGVVEDPDAGSSRLRPIGHSESSIRYARSRPAPFPPRR